MRRGGIAPKSFPLCLAVRGAPYRHPRALKVGQSALYDPGRTIPDTTYVPPVYIEKVIVNNKEAPPDRPANLPVGPGDVEIHYAALGYSSMRQQKRSLADWQLTRWRERKAHRKLLLGIL